MDEQHQAEAERNSVPVSDSDQVHEKELTDTAEGSQGADTHSFRFWIVFLSMCLVAFSSALDLTVITTALPSVTNAIGGQDQFVWIANSFVIASTATQPLIGQLSNIFGRRWPLIISVALFILGSGIAGGASNVGMMIAGRTVAGLGSGGIFVLVDIIICDLVPVRERGKFLGLLLALSAIGTTIGPIVGGVLAKASWRWVFYINIPIAGASLVALFIYLRLNHTPDPTWKHSLARIDYTGSILFISSITSILLGLVLGGTVFPWGSWHTIVPIVLGSVGWVLFHFHQASRFCKEPTMPPRLFNNRTSFVGLILAFDVSMLLEWIIYFLPIYFQGVLGASPLRSGLDILPLNILVAPFAMAAGGFMAKTGKYRILHWTGFALLAISAGLFSLLKTGSRKVEWACFQVVAAAGFGFLMTTIPPSIQAALPESDVATATGAYSFFRSFGFIWGITIPSIVFNGEINNNLHIIQDASVRSTMSNGGGYGFATGGHITSLPEDIRRQVLDVYVKSMKTVWEVAIAFALVGFFAVFVSKTVKLRTELDTQYGLTEGEKSAFKDKTNPVAITAV